MLTYSETILFPVGIYLFKVNNKNTRKRCEIQAKLTTTKKDTKMTSIDMKTQLTDDDLVSFFSTSTYFPSCSTVSYANFERVNARWEFY